MGVRERYYTTHLRQQGQFIQHQGLTQALSDATFSSLKNLIQNEQIPGRDYVYFHLASNWLNHACGYRPLTDDEWMRGSEHVDGILQEMARVLNSNEQFELDDLFQLSFTQVRTAPLGSGMKRKMKPGHSHPETFKRIKHTVGTIKNKDELCCARAIVTAKAKVDNHPKLESFENGRSIQRTEALNLHWEAKVDTKPCGYEEIIKFPMAPSLYSYQLLAIDETRGYRIDSFGPPRDEQLVLLYNQQHYGVLSIFSAISAGIVSNPMQMRENTVVAITQTIAQLVCKMSALITVKQKLSGVQPQFHVTGVKAHSIGTIVSCNTSASPTREK